MNQLLPPEDPLTTDDVERIGEIDNLHIIAKQLVRWISLSLYETGLPSASFSHTRRLRTLTDSIVFDHRLLRVSRTT